MITASVDDRESLRVLIAEGADIQSTDEKGNTILWYPNEAETVSQLVDLGVPINAKNKDGETCLFEHARKGNPETTQEILKKGGDLPVQSEVDKTTAVHNAVLSQDTKTISVVCSEAKEKCPEVLNSGDDKGKTPAHYAAAKGHLEALLVLEESGADLQKRDNFDNNLIHEASANSKVKLIKPLVERGLNINAQNSEGCTSLHIASEMDKTGLTSDELLSAKADITVLDKSYRTPAEIAFHKGNIKAEAMLNDCQLALSGAQKGDLEIGLNWYNYNDLDLSVVTPTNERICFSHRKGLCGGQLDVDENVEPTKNNPVEHIRWDNSSTLPEGRYKVFVVHFRNHSWKAGFEDKCKDPTDFNISVKLNGVCLVRVRGQIAHREDEVPVVQDRLPGEKKPHFFVCAFTYTKGKPLGMYLAQFQNIESNSTR